MKSITRLLTAALSLAVVCLSASGQLATPSTPIANAFLEGPKLITTAQIANGEYVILGSLFRRVGTYTTIEGNYLGTPLKTREGGMDVDRMEGTDIKFKIHVAIDDRDLKDRLIEDRRYRLRGYEMAKFEPEEQDPEGRPAADRQMALAANMPVPASFRSEFHVTKAEDLGPAKGDAK